MGVPVLVVDDDGTIRETLRWLLSEQGYTVYEAPGGEPALQLLRTHREGMVVLLDVHMPRVGGIEVLQALEAEAPVKPRHAYLLLAASDRPVPTELVHELQQLGVPILTKPFDVDVLLAKVAVAARPLIKRSELTRRLTGGRGAGSSLPDTP
jgi:CheY-like chemotaxis protein